jgi:hypothetical protein
MYVALVVRSRTLFFQEGPPSGGGLWWLVFGYCGWCHSSPVLGASIEDGAVELADGEP